MNLKEALRTAGVDTMAPTGNPHIRARRDVLAPLICSIISKASDARYGAPKGGLARGLTY